MIESIVSGRGMVEDHNWNRKKQSFCVQKGGDVSALYYPENETGDSTRPAQRVVAIEDLWDTLVQWFPNGGGIWYFSGRDSTYVLPLFYD